MHITFSMHTLIHPVLLPIMQPYTTNPSTPLAFSISPICCHVRCSPPTSTFVNHHQYQTLSLTQFSPTLSRSTLFYQFRLISATDVRRGATLVQPSKHLKSILCKAMWKLCSFMFSRYVVRDQELNKIGIAIILYLLDNEFMTLSLTLYRIFL